MEKIVYGKYLNWLNSTYIDEADRAELKGIENNQKEIEDRFFTDLSFGTGGIRGVRGVGSNRINKYVIRKATQGLANYINSVTENPEDKSCAIAYDCRIGSEEYALNAAMVLAGNGIKAYLFKTLHSTPELSFAVRELKTQAGIVITASHNPQEYNGYKVYWNDGGQIVDPQAIDIVQAVKNVTEFSMIKLMEKDVALNKGLIVMIDESIDTKYIDAVKKQIINSEIKGKEEFKIVYTPLHGTGGRPVLRMFDEVGFKSVYPVKEQLEGDGMFPTCPYANPEDPAVFKLGIELAEKVGAKIVMANDPDADRIGIACKSVKTGEWVYPNGNQMGLLLMNYILENKKDIPRNAAVISTIVSTPMLDVVAADKGVKLYRTLTGFKFMGEKIREFETGVLDGEYLFGFEESYGYLIGTHARDKDAVVSTMIIAEMAAKYEEQGTDVLSKLDALYKKYGWYKDGITAMTKKGKDGMAEISKMMAGFAGLSETREIIDKKVDIFRDFSKKIEINFITGEKRQLTLPKSDVIQFVFEDCSFVTARPSGTEPKIKYYFGVVDKTEKMAEEKLEKIQKDFEKFGDSFLV